MDMQKKLLATLVIAASFLARTPVLAGDCAPGRVVKITVANESPAIPAGNFALKPKTIYRYGATLARIEEEPDREHKIQGLIVVNEPDSWIVNLATKQGTHAVDEKKPFVVRLPVFADHAEDHNFPRELLALEFGCESEFFDHWKSPEEPFRNDPAGRLKRAFGVNDWLAVLVREKSASAPTILFLMKSNEIVGAYRYLSFETVPADATLFAKPLGVAIAEAPPN